MADRAATARSTTTTCGRCGLLPSETCNRWGKRAKPLSEKFTEMLHAGQSFLPDPGQAIRPVSHTIPRWHELMPLYGNHSIHLPVRSPCFPRIWALVALKSEPGSSENSVTFTHLSGPPPTYPTSYPTGSTTDWIHGNCVLIRDA